jgi:hypothetical protein
MGFNTVLLPYGEALRQHRKIYHQILRAEASVSYHEMYFRQAGGLVLNLLTATVADDLRKNIEMFVSNSFVSFWHLV